MALSYTGLTIWRKTPDTLERTKNLNTFKHNLKEHYLKELRNSNFCQLSILKTKSLQYSPLLVFMQFLNGYYSTFVEEPQCKCKQFDACIVLSCHQQKCYIFVNFDEYNLFEILLLLFTFLVFNLVFKHFFVIFHIFFGKYTLTCISHVTLVFPLLTLNSKCRQGNFMKMPAFTGKSLKPVHCQD